MRRFQISNAALVAGLAVLLSGCSGETPTAPSANGGGGNGNGSGSGSCTVLVSMSATTQSPFVGTAAIVRATVTRSGKPVPDGGSVQYTTDLGFFEENGLNTISKTTVGGVADVTVFSSNSGTAHVKAVFDCANAQINLNFGGVPDVGPFISSLSPTTGSCAGGDTVTILGGRFGNGTNVDVFFGGVRSSIKGVATNTQIIVTTPAHPLKNPAVPETVNVVVVVNGLTSPPFQFTYACIPPELKIFISSINPTAGSPAGGDTVQIFGGHFGTNIATTQVTFCGASAQITAQNDQQITVTTPRHVLANPAISETCDVSVRRDIGLVSENSATLPQAFTYRGNGSGATCNTDPTFFIASLTPNSGPPEGGTSVTITGSGFGSNSALLRVDFGGTPATILAVQDPTHIVVSTPRRTLANPSVPETVDVTVTDLGSPVQRCARVVSGFVYTVQALDPIIYSVSPRTGPNDASTRVSIFGTGFQFPMQVFMTGGTGGSGPGCGAQRVEAAVSDISLNTIVFKTPVAVGGNVCLSNQLVDIVILNPSTGKTASCPACFKYYACPTITTADPVFGDYRGVPRVVVNGHNFEEPIAISGAGTPWVPISVSSESIIATAPQPINIPGCADISGQIRVNSPSLSCPDAVGPIFTYIVVALGPVIYSINPTHVSEAGGETVTITGKNFLVDPHTSLGINFGAGGGSERITPTTMTDTQIVFVAPKFGGTFLKIACDLPGGTTGTKKIPTPVQVLVTNPTTHCFAGVGLLYDPDDQTCHAGSGGVTIAANFTFTNGPGGSLIVNFTDTSTATGTTINHWDWDFGDGSPVVGIDKPPASNGSTSHTFTGPGTFNVTLSATDGTIIGVKSQSVTPP